MSAAATLQFPSKINIITYLRQHPLTNKKTSPVLTTTKILETVAALFADQKQDPSSVSLNTTLAVNKTMKSLGLQPALLGPIVTKISQLVTTALIDCANGKAIEVEKAV